MKQLDSPARWGRPPVVTLLFTVAVVALIAIPFFLRLPLIETRGFNPDELEHLHFSWCVSKGMVPYRDYFDHHTPWFHFFLAPFYSFYDVERLGDDAIGFIYLARRWTWLFAGVLLTLTFLLGRAWRDSRTGLLATLLLGNTAFFLAKSFEIRPGVPGAALLMASVLLTLLAVRRVLQPAAGASSRFLAGGIAFGAAIMITQKALFVGPGLAMSVAWLLLDRRVSIRFPERLKCVVALGAGFLLPVALTLLYFGFKGALWRFIDYNFILNTRWPGLPAGGFLVELARQDPFFVLLGSAGFLVEARRAFAAHAVRRGEPVVTLATLSLWATLAVHPAMSYHHFLLILPVTSLYASAALIRLVDGLAGRFQHRPRCWTSGVTALAAVVVGVLACYGLLQIVGPRDLSLSPFVTPVLMGLALTLPFLVWIGSRNGLLLVLVLLLSAYPLERFRATFERGNWGTIQGIRYVLRNTAPWETTFDGFTGLGLFRPQAFFHQFQHPHVFALQTEEEHREMLDKLRTGRALPKFIFWSHYLRDAVTPEIKAFLEEHYVATGLESIRVRPFDNGLGWWSDERPRYLGWVPDEKTAPHVLFEYGWRAPDFEYGMPVRRTRTRKSKLIVPIRYPRDFKIIFRAHADADSVPFAVELVVNGISAGVVEAVPRWQDYEFVTTVNPLRPGFNEFELRFSAENDNEARRLELAVYSMTLTPFVREQESG